MSELDNLEAYKKNHAVLREFFEYAKDAKMMSYTFANGSGLKKEGEFTIGYAAIDSVENFEFSLREPSGNELIFSVEQIDQNFHYDEGEFEPKGIVVQAAEFFGDYVDYAMGEAQITKSETIPGLMEFVISGSCHDFCDGAASVLNVRVVGKQAGKPKPVKLKSEYPSYLKKLKQKNSEAKAAESELDSD